MPFHRRPYPNLVIRTYREQNVVYRLVLMARLTPVYARDGARMRQVGNVEPNLLRPKRGPPPYLDKSIIFARRRDEAGVV